MQGLFFYWMAWITWIIVTFFMAKGKVRNELAFLILIVILLSNRFVTVAHVSICLSLFPLLLYGYRKLGELKGSQLIYMVSACHIVMLAYIGFSLYALYAPAILWLDERWMAAGLVFLLVQVLVRTLSMRCLTAVIATVHGNLLFTGIMKGFSLPVKAGTHSFFGMLSACLAIIAIWWGYQEFISQLNRYFKRISEHRGHYTK